MKIVSFLGEKTGARFYELSINDQLAKIGRNFVRVHVYLQNMDIEVIGILSIECLQFIEESEAYPLTLLMSDMGGVFGLYIGLKLVGFVELIEMGALSAYLWYQTTNRVKNVGAQSP